VKESIDITVPPAISEKTVDGKSRSEEYEGYGVETFKYRKLSLNLHWYVSIHVFYEGTQILAHAPAILPEMSRGLEQARCSILHFHTDIKGCQYCV
jgi:hypothetical protein